MASSFSGSNSEGNPATSWESSVRASAGSDTQDSGFAYFSTSWRCGRTTKLLRFIAATSRCNRSARDRRIASFVSGSPWVDADSSAFPDSASPP